MTIVKVRAIDLKMICPECGDKYIISENKDHPPVFVILRLQWFASKHKACDKAKVQPQEVKEKNQ